MFFLLTFMLQLFWEPLSFPEYACVDKTEIPHNTVMEVSVIWWRFWVTFTRNEASGRDLDKGGQTRDARRPQTDLGHMRWSTLSAMLVVRVSYYDCYIALCCYFYDTDVESAREVQLGVSSFKSLFWSYIRLLTNSLKYCWNAQLS